MANMRYFNLKALNNVKLSNFDPKTNVRRVFDPINSDWSNHGDLNAATSLPKHVLGAGKRGSFISTGFHMGSIATASVDDIDYGSIA